VKSIERRLAAIEQRLMPSRAGPLVIIFEGGFGGEPMFATAGDLRWERAPDETLGDFEARAVAAGTAAGERFIFIGGCGGHLAGGVETGLTRQTVYRIQGDPAASEGARALGLHADDLGSP
jgi:hypothetical protein